MNKRIVLEHSNGLRQICGILDIADGTDLERQLLHDRLSWNLVTAGKRHVVYREVSREAPPSGKTGTCTQCSGSCYSNLSDFNPVMDVCRTCQLAKETPNA